LDAVKAYCENCGHNLKPQWLFCASCGNNINEFQPVLCGHCNHMIDDPQPNFCPYCRFKVQEIETIIQKVPTVLPTVQKPVELTPIELVISDEKVTIKQIVSNLKFDREATIGIVNSSSFSVAALILIILVGVFYAVSFFILDWIFTGGATFQPDLYIGGAIFQVSILIAIGFFENMIASILQAKTSNLHFFRLMGSYAPLFIVKDLLILPLILYINFFQPSEGHSQASAILNTATIIIFIFLFIHIIVFTRSVTRTGAAVSSLLVSLAFILAFIFVLGYLIPTFQVIYDFLAL
jgi:hypothetical protein